MTDHAVSATSTGDTVTRFGVALCVAAIAATACADAPDQSTGAGGGAESAVPVSAAHDSAAVIAVVAAHRSAISSGDAAAVASHHRPDLTFFGPESPHLVTVSSDAPETVALLERFSGSTATWRPRDVQIQMFGDVAVAAFFIDGSATYADGTTDTRTRRVTEVWIRNADGEWQETHHHESPVEN